MVKSLQEPLHFCSVRRLLAESIYNGKTNKLNPPPERTLGGKSVQTGLIALCKIINSQRENSRKGKGDCTDHVSKQDVVKPARNQVGGRESCSVPTTCCQHQLTQIPLYFLQITCFLLLLQILDIRWLCFYYVAFSALTNTTHGKNTKYSLFEQLMKQSI